MTESDEPQRAPCRRDLFQELGRGVPLPWPSPRSAAVPRLLNGSRYGWLNGALILALTLLMATQGASGESVPAGKKGFQSNVAPFLKRHCITCHGPTEHKADFRLDDIEGDLSSARHLARWERILEMLEAGEMPPAEQPQPDSSERQAVIEWITNGLRSSIEQTDPVVAAPTARRLTNFEYQNTMRDLLGFELFLSRYLPEDPARPYRFNNTAEYLLMGVEQLEHYEANARRAMASAIVDPSPPEVARVRMEWGPQTSRNPVNELAITGNRRGSPADGLKITSWPTTGEYRIRVKAAGVFPDNIGEMPLRIVMGYGLAGDIGNSPFETVGTIRLTDAHAEPQLYEFRGRIENHPSEPERQARRGGTRTGNLVTYPANMMITPQNLFDDGTLNDDLDPLVRPRALVESIEFEAPVTDVWPPDHHTRILFSSPLRERDPDAYVREVLKRFMTRAFRRPVQPEEVARYFRIHQVFAADLPMLEDSIRETLAMVLSSPNFLYHTVARDDSNRHYEAASRLSYFLWGSMPDQELFDLAERQMLFDPETIETQVRRLLADDRSRDFIRNFTTQWLAIDKLHAVPINVNRFPRFLYTLTRGERAGAEVPFRTTIRDDMREETIAFVGELIKRNASVLNIVDSDFAMLNQRLATHYGVAGVEGHELRPVDISPEHHLGGLLTHGSILIANSTGSVPHPIYRAVWLREAILGDEVKDPPADVPALSDSVDASLEKVVTIKDLLRQHRQQESCNDCHARLDAWGIPFEQYNAVGRFQPIVPREGMRVRGFDPRKDQDLDEYEAYLSSINTIEVEADAELPNGPRVTGLVGLKKYLLEQRSDDVARNVIRRLLSYALGRNLTYRDRFVVDELLERSKRNDHRMLDMIISICQSDLFTGRNR